LEDNKVEQWSDKYIDYEKLKSVLKKAKAAANQVEELKKKLPKEVVEGCLKEYADCKAAEAAVRQQLLQQKNGEGPNEEKLPLPSYLEISRSSSSLPPLAETPMPTDTTPLMGERRPSCGSAASAAELSTGGGSASFKRQNSWGSMAVLKVASYMGLADEKQVLLKGLHEADNRLESFKETYNGEVTKVKDFYQDKLNEISQHIEAIIESVDTSRIKTHKKARRSSMFNDLVHKFENAIHNKKAYGDLRGGGSLDNFPLIRASVSQDSAEDVMADTEGALTQIKSQSSSDKLDLERESDSIKRALTDIYRDAKMLHNYAIMNFTACLKIAKKFDKTLPAYKGLFKDNICDDGMQAEVLAAKIVSVNLCLLLGSSVLITYLTAYTFACRKECTQNGSATATSARHKLSFSRKEVMGL
jgi:hypothetical protein